MLRCCDRMWAFHTKIDLLEIYHNIIPISNQMCISCQTAFPWHHPLTSRKPKFFAAQLFRKEMSTGEPVCLPIKGIVHAYYYYQFALSSHVSKATRLAHIRDRNHSTRRDTARPPHVQCVCSQRDSYPVARSLAGRLFLCPWQRWTFRHV